MWRALASSEDEHMSASQIAEALGLSTHMVREILENPEGWRVWVVKTKNETYYDIYDARGCLCSRLDVRFAAQQPGKKLIDFYYKHKLKQTPSELGSPTFNPAERTL